MDDQCQRTPGLQHVVDGLRHQAFVGPVERLAECHQPGRPGRDRGQILGQTLDPPDVRDCLFLGRPAALRKHAGIWVQTGRLLEQVSKADSEHAWAAADVQEPAAPVQTRLLRQDGLKLRRVRRAAVAIVGSGAEVDGGSYGTAPVTPDRQLSPVADLQDPPNPQGKSDQLERHRSDPLCEPHVKTPTLAAFDWNGQNSLQCTDSGGWRRVA